MGNPTHTQAWKELNDLSKRDISTSFIGMMETDFGLSIDFSNSFISDEILSNLINLAREQDVENWRDRMVRGDHINHTEDRPVGHMWLRSGDKSEVLNVLKKMQQFVAKTHDCNQFTDVVNIGIGGSDLGPRLVCDALKFYPQKLKPHFVANIDGADIEETLKGLNPDTTLFIIASKTFTTAETMANANFAKKWLGDRDIAKHVIALSTNQDGVAAFGIDTDNMFPFWDWVGGRYSVWSSIGMSIALSYGFDVFEELLNGARAMDDHFCNTPLDQNLPVLLALYGVWNRNFMNRSAVAVLPYVQNLSLLTNYLQQLDMESNGKSVDRDGEFITDYQTGPIIFGQAGTNGQHAFHQWLHQGTDIVPCEVISCVKTPYDKEHHGILNANAMAQMQAFAIGRESLGDKNRHYGGGRPSVHIQVQELNSFFMGAILALYEHKIFIQGIIWNINSFDQYGVELGKKLANDLLNQN